MVMSVLDLRRERESVEASKSLTGLHWVISLTQQTFIKLLPRSGLGKVPGYKKVSKNRHDFP